MKTPILALLVVLATQPWAVAQSQLQFRGPATADTRSVSSSQPGSSAPLGAPPSVELLAPPKAGYGQPGMTLPELEAMALGNSPSLRQASARVDVARGRWVQSGLYPNPTLGYQGSEIGNEGKAGQQGAFASQEFVMGGKLRLSRSVAAQEVAQAEQNLAAQRFRVLNDVRVGFYSVLVAQRMLELTGELTRVAERATQTADKLFKSQEASRVDLLQAKIEADAAIIVRENARNRYVTSWRRLAAAVATPDMVPVPLVGDLQACWRDLTWEVEIARLLNESPELAAAQAAIARASWALRRARVEPKPNINLQAGVQYDNASQDTISNAQLGITVPLFDRNQGNIYAAQGELASAQADIRRLELELTHRLAAAFERYANARQQTRLYSQTILPNAKSSLDLVTLGYEQGEFPFLTLLTAQRTYFQTNVAYVEALRDLWESQVAIEGMLLFENMGPDDRAATGVRSN